MPLQLPVLDNSSFEAILAEARRRIPVHTPEWTNFAGDSDPGITLVQLFAFMADGLLYRANRIPERNRLKFLQLLGIPLQPAATARGIVTLLNERGPVAGLPLDRGVVVTAGEVGYLTRDGVTVLPVEAQVYYKQPISRDDPRYAGYLARYQAVRLALAAEQDEDADPEDVPLDLDFYESALMSLPTPANPSPLLDLAQTSDLAIYIVLLAPRNVDPALVREALANEVLSIGVAPALAGSVPPLLPARLAAQRRDTPRLIYEIADVRPDASDASYSRLRLVQDPDVLSDVGVVQVQLPEVAGLQTWELADPLREGVGRFPPRIEDEQVRERVVTWLRVSLAPAEPGVAQPTARLNWVGINAARIVQAVPVVNELLGVGSGEPDQSFAVANTPVIPSSFRLVVEGPDGLAQLWRMTDDLLAAQRDELVFTLDPEAGVVRFGDGMRGARPPGGRRLAASYEYGGGLRGNVAIGAIKASPDPRLQGGFKVENPLATWGGDLGQSLNEAERDIPLTLRHRDRLVTALDFRDVTLRTPGVDVGRVEVLTLFRPDNPGATAAGVVTVLVVPRFDAVRPRWPMPDRLFLRTVCDYLDERRLITTEVYVRGPTYIPVYVTVGIKVRAGFFADVVRQQASDRLYEYLSALPPGGPDLAGWPLDKRLLDRDLEAVVTRVPGVEFVNQLHLGVDVGAGVIDASGEHALSGLELPMLSRVSVVEGDAEPLAAVLDSQPEAAPGGRSVVPVPVSRTKC